MRGFDGNGGGPWPLSSDDGVAGRFQFLVLPGSGTRDTVSVWLELMENKGRTSCQQDP